MQGPGKIPVPLIFLAVSKSVSRTTKLDVNQTDSNGQIQTGLTEAAQHLTYAYVNAAAFHQKSPSHKAC